ncbi:helix-turn-helix domain-containing protein [Moheibacter lacus]|nr:XRE family transcriptional regulator [Moheibacter lacus]
MEEEYVKLIFGLKLRQIRTDKGLSLFQLGKISGLSKSYLNEIEKGKKYPKTDKIILLAESLEVSYEDLVSLKLDKNLAPISGILQSKLLKEIPFELFGIEERDLIEIISNAPSKVNAFISTMIEIGNNYNLTRESFFLAALRSYQEANDNYFPEIEAAAKNFMKAYLIDEKDEINEDWMLEILKEEFGYQIIFEDFSSELQTLRSIYKPKNKELYINNSADLNQIRFILAKELGYNYLKLEERLLTFSWAKFESFDQLLNNFYASYFAGAILLPEENLVRDMNRMFDINRFNPEIFENVMRKYTESPETIYQRMTNLFAKHFKINDLFFLRLSYKVGTDSYKLTKELHLNQHQSPHANESDEHYCRRWVSVRVLQDFEKVKDEKSHLLDAQISVYPFQNQNEYFVISSATVDPFNSDLLRSVTLGVKLEAAQKKIKFLKDPKIPVKKVAVTCENCGMENCSERAAHPKRYLKKLQNQQLNEAIDAFIGSN